MTRALYETGRVRRPISPIEATRGFLTQLDARFLTNSAGDRAIELLAPLVWFDLITDESIIVPARYRSNGGTIPRLLWSLVGHPLDEDKIRSTVLHDWGCEMREDWSSTTVHDRLYHSLRADGNGYYTATTYRIATRTFGPRWRTSPQERP
ncbi:MAG TPA: DUF1353 domain-containing protein [Gemmatimonas sp.]|nr:DUF1353 domain-containing protein [Gemmatimonas sp.]